MTVCQFLFPTAASGASTGGMALENAEWQPWLEGPILQVADFLILAST